MKTGMLFELPIAAPRRQTKLTSFKRLHGIMTYRSPSLRPAEEPWIALIPFESDKGKELAEIMAESCRLYDESGQSATGRGELSSIRSLCGNLGIECTI